MVHGARRQRHLKFYPERKTFRRFPLPTGRPDSRPMGPPEVNARGERPGPGPSARSSRPFGIAVDPEGTCGFLSSTARRSDGSRRRPPTSSALPAWSVRPRCTSASSRARDAAPVHAHHNREVPMADRLDLSALAPGPHTLDVRLPGASRPVATSQFVVDPLQTPWRRWHGGSGRTRQQSPRSRARSRRYAKDGRMRRVESFEVFWAPRSPPAISTCSLRTCGTTTCSPNANTTCPSGAVRRPRVVSVEVGDAIVIANEGSTPIQVSVRDGDCAPEVVGVGRTFRHAFSREGIFQYRNRRHRSRGRRLGRCQDAHHLHGGVPHGRTWSSADGPRHR